MSWVGPGTTSRKTGGTGPTQMYRALVVDSGPIIRQTGLTSLRHKAQLYYTVPAVVQEIRDAKARQHLQQLPFDLKEKEPTPEAVAAVTNFARQTGDYTSLSRVDLQVLALQYDLEKEGCGGDMKHVRTTPKRKLGVGKIQSLGGGIGDGDAQDATATAATTAGSNAEKGGESKQADGVSFFQSGAAIEDVDIVEEDSEDEENDVIQGDQSQTNPVAKEKQGGSAQPATPPPASKPGPKSWAMLVNPNKASASLPKVTASPMKASDVKDLSAPFGKMKLVQDRPSTAGDGQFSDAEDDEDDFDVSVMEQQHQPQTPAFTIGAPQPGKTVEEELQMDFPSLGAASTVPYEGSDDEAEPDVQPNNIDVAADAAAASNDTSLESHGFTKEELEQRKKTSLQQVSKSGKTYNSFRKYGKLMKPKPAKKKAAATASSIDENNDDDDDADDEMNEAPQPTSATSTKPKSTQSRIIGGMGGQEDQIEDDGEGWITSTADIRSMKSSGILDPTRKPGDQPRATQKETGPPITMRTACTTTDFAMQNVILQMNLELLSVDGMKIRKLKSWVMRCGACFKIYADTANQNNPTLHNMKRMFCAHCGSDMMHRIAASVDGKTGRLRVHLKKNYQHNLRGTKFSLPKAGSGNRFQGDLLLREDQMLTGVWNQKVKIRSGGQSRSSAQSMFGRDIATSVGCNSKGVVSVEDIKVGFGRRNPNSAKGRERRGKKKKSSEKACGLRRY